MRKVCALALACLCLIACLTSCEQSQSLPASDGKDATDAAKADVAPSVEWTNEDRDGTPALENATVITLKDGGSTVSGDGAMVEKDVVTVTAGGLYVVEGSLSNGQLRVESDDETTVRLVLNGATVHSDTTAPLFIKQSKKTVLTLATGTDNALSDSANAVLEDTENEEPSGTLFSKSDLTINGDGTLAVTAAFRDGIVSRDGLKLAGGTVQVTAADDAVMGRDYVLMGGGDYTLTAAGDGVKSTNDGGDTVGFIRLEDGKLTIDSDKDGVQATSSLTVDGGAVTVKAGGGAQNGTANVAFDFGWGQQSTDTESSGKGLKAGTALAIRGGTVQIDAADDAVHSNGTIAVQGGNTTAAAGDDGVHADTSVTIDGGVLTVTKSYEALEAATISINDGEVSLTASDDGVNASAGTSGSTGDPGGQDPFASDDSSFAIHGGTLYVDAGGDGLDSNGTMEMDGGVVTVCGPSNSGNGTFDFGASFRIRGGTLIGIGSMGMAQTPTENTQQSIVWGGCSLQSGDRLTVTDASGNVIATITSARSAEWAYVTLPDLQEGDTYTLADGNTTQTVTLQSGMNTVGTVSGGMMGGPGGMGGDMGGPGGHGGPGGRHPGYYAY